MFIHNLFKFEMAFDVHSFSCLCFGWNRDTKLMFIQNMTSDSWMECCAAMIDLLPWIEIINIFFSNSIIFCRHAETIDTFYFIQNYDLNKSFHSLQIGSFAMNAWMKEVDLVTRFSFTKMKKTLQFILASIRCTRNVYENATYKQ